MPDFHQPPGPLSLGCSFGPLRLGSPMSQTFNQVVSQTKRVRLRCSRGSSLRLSHREMGCYFPPSWYIPDSDNQAKWQRFSDAQHVLNPIPDCRTA